MNEKSSGKKRKENQQQTILTLKLKNSCFIYEQKKWWNSNLLQCLSKMAIRIGRYILPFQSSQLSYFYIVFSSFWWFSVAKQYIIYQIFNHSTLILSIFFPLLHIVHTAFSIQIFFSWFPVHYNITISKWFANKWRVCLIARVFVLGSRAQEKLHSKLKVNHIFCATFTYVSQKCGRKKKHTIMDLVASKKKRKKTKSVFFSFALRQMSFLRLSL